MWPRATKYSLVNRGLDTMIPTQVQAHRYLYKCDFFTWVYSLFWKNLFVSILPLFWRFFFQCIFLEAQICTS